MYADADEEGEPVYDPDEQLSDRNPEPEEDEWQDSPTSSPSTLIFNSSKRPAKEKPRKRLVKKSNTDESAEPFFDDEEDRSLKRKSKDSEKGGGRKKLQKLKRATEGKEDDYRRDGKDKGKSGSAASKLAKLARQRVSERNDRDGGSDRTAKTRNGREEETRWDGPPAADDSEEDKELLPTADDDNFIDDEGVERYSDDEGGYGGGSPSHAPEAEEAQEGKDDEDDLGKFFKSKRKVAKAEWTAEEKAMYVEQFMAKLDVAAETDADLNRNSKPAIQKLKMLPELVKVLEKRQLQQEFLDRGVLSSLKNWLEPLPDGSLPNMNIRSALLKLLTDLPIDLEVFERREQLKKSGLGKVVMFLSKLQEETPLNKKYARDLVDKWSRPIFSKSTRYEDLRQADDDRPLPRRPIKRPDPKLSIEDARGGDDLETIHDSGEPKPGQPGYRLHASRPQALPLDFVIRPQSKIDGESSRALERQQREEERRAKMNKKLQQLRTPKKKNLQATRLSVEGRGLVKYF